MFPAPRGGAARAPLTHGPSGPGDAIGPPRRAAAVAPALQPPPVLRRRGGRPPPAGPQPCRAPVPLTAGRPRGENPAGAGPSPSARAPPCLSPALLPGGVHRLSVRRRRPPAAPGLSAGPFRLTSGGKGAGEMYTRTHPPTPPGTCSVYVFARVWLNFAISALC